MQTSKVAKNGGCENTIENMVTNENESIECMDCSKICKSMEELIQHYNETPDHPEVTEMKALENFEICEKNVDPSDSLNQELNQQNFAPNIEKVTPRFTCGICDKVFQSETSFKFHQKYNFHQNAGNSNFKSTESIEIFPSEVKDDKEKV